MKKVSVIIPCYNQSEYLHEAVMSVINSTYQNVEIIVINDGSTDVTHLDMTNLLKDYENVKLINQENSGVCIARNNGIELCNGDYILPLDADDKIESTYIEDNSDIGIVYCEVETFGKMGGQHLRLKEAVLKNMLIQNRIFSSAIFRKSLFYDAGGYKPEMENGCEDWDLWLSFVEHGFEVYKLKEEMFFYRKYNTKTRTDYADNSLDSILKNLFLNHINLYINNEEFYDRVFSVQKNKKKYRRLFNIFLVISIVEFIVIMLLLIKG